MQRIFLILYVLSSASLMADNPFEGSINSFLGKPTLQMQQLFKGERFPNIAVSTQGTVIATWGNKSVICRRSEDGGQTWGEAITIADPGFQGGGLTVDEATGDIFTFIEAHHPPAPVIVYRSKDDGKTWEKQDSLFIKDSNGNLPSMHMNEHGITLRHGKHKGRVKTRERVQ